jgi:hypothetical protein
MSSVVFLRTLLYAEAATDQTTANNESLRADYLMSQTIKRRMVGMIMNNELTRASKEAVMA